MGKALKVVSIIGAIAVNVVPGVGQVLSAAIASTVTSLGVASALGFAAKALGVGPKQARISQATASLPPVLQERLGRTTLTGVTVGQSAFSGNHAPRAGMQPIRPRHHLRRWQIEENSGDCMVPHTPANLAYTLTDREAEIRPDDLVSFKVKRRFGGGSKGLTKRFVTATDTHFEFQTTNPTVETYRLPRAHVAWMYRNRAHLRDATDWARRSAEINANPLAHNERLAVCVYSERLLD